MLSVLSVLIVLKRTWQSISPLWVFSLPLTLWVDFLSEKWLVRSSGVHLDETATFVMDLRKLPCRWRMMEPGLEAWRYSRWMESCMQTWPGSLLSLKPWDASRRD